MTDNLAALKGAVWHCEPLDWSLDRDVLSITTGAETDFWRGTYYGFNRDDGHFYGAEAHGDFTAVVAFEGNYETLYDQAGMMMRIDRDAWIKTGIEFSDEVTNFSVVVTRDGRSDWSVINVPQATGVQRVRMTRIGTAVVVHRQDSAGIWQLMRLTHFPDCSAVRIGPMACSPQRSGFTARFEAFGLIPPVDNPLHGG